MTPLSLEDGQRIVSKFVEEYNEVRLHSAIGYVTPRDMLEGRQAAIHAERDRKVAEARERRSALRAEQTPARRNGEMVSYTESSRPEDRALLGSNPSAESMTEAPVGSS